MSIIKFFRNCLLLFVIFCIITAYVDYKRIISNKEPIFCIKKLNPITKVLSYRGFFYQADRIIKTNTNERMSESLNVHYTYLFKTISISYNRENNIGEYTFFITKEKCNNFKEYYKSDNITIYSNCISSFKVKNNKESIELKELLINKQDILDELILEFSFMGMYESYSLKYSVADDLSNKTFNLYRCLNSNNIYITDSSYLPNNICK